MILNSFNDVEIWYKFFWGRRGWERGELEIYKAFLINTFAYTKGYFVKIS